MSAFGKIDDPKFVSVTISDKTAVYPALKKFFSKSPVKEAIETDFEQEEEEETV
jgi:uncharacterized sporulation protein YeaH/YhbH (DUF444 family)